MTKCSNAVSPSSLRISMVLGLLVSYLPMGGGAFASDGGGGGIPGIEVQQAQVGVTKFCSASSGSPGYMPQCDKVSEGCTKTALGQGKEKSPDSNGDCAAGQLKVQRFNASAERQMVCLDVSGCGSNVALCQRWNSTDKVVRYSCVTNSAFVGGK